MRRDHRSTRHHLRLIQGENQDVVLPIHRSPSPGQLTGRIVKAAQEWAAAALAGPYGLDTSTEEGRLLLAVLDAVQDMEYHCASITITGQLSLDMGPGTPSA